MNKGIHIRRVMFWLLLALNVCFRLTGQTGGRSLVKDAAPVLQAIAKASEGLGTIRSDFVQKRHIDLLANDVESSGTLTFAKPDRVRWEYNKPYSYIIVLDKTKITIRNNAKTNSFNAGSNEFFKQLSGIIKGLVQGDLLSNPAFTSTLFDDGRFWVAVMVPVDKAMQDYLSKVELTFDKNTKMVVSVRMIEPSGDFTHIVFLNQRYNEVVDPNTFVLK